MFCYLAKTLTFESIILHPPVSEWPVHHSELRNVALNELRRQARKRLVDSSEQFVLRLSQKARQAGLLATNRPLLTADPDASSIVMTGHQPVIFHSGLTFKYQQTESFARHKEMIAVAVVIDTDEGDAGAFSIPVADKRPTAPPDGPADNAAAIPAIVARSFSIAQSAGLFSSSRLKESFDLIAEFKSAEDEIRRTCTSDSADAFHSVAEDYVALAKLAPTMPTLEANLITRWNAGIGGGMLEIPLSAICCFPEFIRFTAALLERPFEFAACYNKTLNSFRAAQQIRNEANPFPNLTIEDTWCELPYWVIDNTAKTRHVLQVHKESGSLSLRCVDKQLVQLVPGQTAEGLTSLLFGNVELVPRGAMITATLRLLFSDVFVHGTGGGQYDPCTDELIRNWWQEEPTPFAVASASRYLFSSARSRLAELQQASSQLRDMQYNPQRFLNSGVFSDQLQEKLNGLLKEKETRVQQMKEARGSGQSAKDLGRQIQEITDAIKAAVSEEFEPRLAELRRLKDQNASAITSRTWPWFLFAENQ